MFLLACVALGGDAWAQAVAAEFQQNVGASSEAGTVAASQVRVFGEPLAGVRFKVEGSVGHHAGKASDLLGTAYPYEGGADVIEAYAEYFLPTGRFVRSLRGGRYRTPFGISSASEHAYVGFLRPPLIRYGEYYALSSGYLEHGVDVVVGVPQLSAELSVGRPADVGEAIRRPGVDTVARVEASKDALIVGASVVDTTPYLPARFARGRSRFGGVDVRWMRGGVQLRGEWIAGRPFDGVSTSGGYVDLLLHRPAMGPVTMLMRAERLDYNTAPQFALHTARYHAGLRVRLWQGLSVAAGTSHQVGQLTQSRRTALDAGVSYSVRKDY